MKKTLLIFALLIVGLAGHAQNATIIGEIILDNDTTCTTTAFDDRLGDVIVIAEDTFNNRYYGNSQPYSGRYYMAVPPGTYNVSLRFPYDHPYQTTCTPSYTTVLGAAQIDTLNYYVFPNNGCPLLHVDVGAGELPDCGSAKYTLNYYNFGMGNASGAEIQVFLDSSTTLDSASSPFTSLGNGVYQFNIGTVAIDRDTSQQIELDVTISCNAEPTQTHCVKATITALNACPTGWNGPELAVRTENAVDSVAFIVRNNGALNMSVAGGGIITEDDLMYSPVSIGPLNTGSEDTIWVTTQAGSTYRLEVDQDSFIPRIAGAPVAWAAIEGAKPDVGGTFNTDFYTQYYTDNTAPNEAYDCQQGDTVIIYNNIRLQNRGYDNPGFINDNTPLEYQYRFQNVGNQNVTSFMIIDTLDPAIDPSSIILGASNMGGVHWNLEGSGVLQVQFTPLLLTPASLDPDNSKGFINFHFLQKPGNPVGTVIEKRAAYVFGNNTIMTPTVINTIGVGYIRVVSTQVHYQPKAIVKVYPNPMSELANFEVEGIEYEELQLQLFSAAGQLITERQATPGSPLQLHRNSLPAGIYFYRLLADGQPVDSGRVVIR